MTFFVLLMGAFLSYPLSTFSYLPPLLHKAVLTCSWVQIWYNRKYVPSPYTPTIFSQAPIASSLLWWDRVTLSLHRTLLP